MNEKVFNKLLVAARKAPPTQNPVKNSNSISLLGDIYEL